MNAEVAWNTVYLVSLPYVIPEQTFWFGELECCSEERLEDKSPAVFPVCIYTDKA